MVCYIIQSWIKWRVKMCSHSFFFLICVCAHTGWGSFALLPKPFLKRFNDRLSYCSIICLRFLNFYIQVGGWAMWMRFKVFILNQVFTVFRFSTSYGMYGVHVFHRLVMAFCNHTLLSTVFESPVRIRNIGFDLLDAFERQCPFL